MRMSWSSTDWLRKWFDGGAELIEIPNDLLTDIYYAQSSEINNEIMLYRGLLATDDCSKGKFRSRKITSWTKSKEIAERYYEEIIGIRVDYSYVLFDTTKYSVFFLIKLRCQTQENREVILLPGIFPIVYSSCVSSTSASSSSCVSSTSASSDSSSNSSTP